MHAANSPKGILRNPETLARFKGEFLSILSILMMRLRQGDMLMQQCMLLIALKVSSETQRHWQDLKVS